MTDDYVKRNQRDGGLFWSATIIDEKKGQKFKIREMPEYPVVTREARDARDAAA